MIDFNDWTMRVNDTAAKAMRDHYITDDLEIVVGNKMLEELDSWIRAKSYNPTSHDHVFGKNNIQIRTNAGVIKVVAEPRLGEGEWGLIHIRSDRDRYMLHHEVMRVEHDHYESILEEEPNTFLLELKAL
jgi:hypothetical protein